MKDATERKREEAMQESEERYRGLFENALDGMYRSTVDGRFIDVNPALVKMLGYESKEDLLSVDIPKDIYLSESDRPSKGERDRVRVNQLKKKDGTPIWVESSSRVISDKEDNIVYEGIVRDITRRKWVEKELLTRERQLAESQRVAQLGSWEWDVVNNKITWSDELFRIFGVDPEKFEATYEAFLSMVHPEDREALDSAVKESLKSRKPYHVDARIIRLDGSEWIMEARGKVTYDKSGKPILMSGTAQDITERKRAEEALRESERMHRNLMETAPIGISISTPEGALTEVNPAMLKIFGYDSKEEFLKIPVTALYYNPKDRDRFLELIKKGRVKDFEIQYKRKDGTLFWASETSMIQTTETGATQFINTVQDITERKRAEEELQTRVDELEKFTDVAVDRELKMIELKDKIKELERRLAE